MKDLGHQLHDSIRGLYPICRSITGDGLRETLHMIREQIPIELREVPSGTQVLDWIVPREWNIRDAWIKDSAGDRLVDFRKLNLHVVNYSVPIKATMRLAELKDHFFTLPEHPERVPYRTSYYKERWGFCLSEQQLQRLREDEDYEVSLIPLWRMAISPTANCWCREIARKRSWYPVMSVTHRSPTITYLELPLR